MAEWPTEHEAEALVSHLMASQVATVERFRTGLAHYVYEVVTQDQRHVVVRMALPKTPSLDGAVYWSERLRPLGIPLPAILADDRRASVTPFPALILERVPGTDLGHVYATLSPEQKTAIAREIVAIQQRVGSLPHGSGYGFATSYQDQNLLPTWQAVVERSLARSAARIQAAGAADPAHVERVQRLVPRFAAYFEGIPPAPFLDDTTTKNVLIDHGRLSGIVDVDMVCFGDPLFTVGLTNMALLSAKYDFSYIEAWCHLLSLSQEQRTIIQFYSCVFCLDFLAEIGLAVNHNQTLPFDHAWAAHLLGVLDTLLSTLA